MRLLLSSPAALTSKLPARITSCYWSAENTHGILRINFYNSPVRKINISRCSKGKSSWCWSQSCKYEGRFLSSSSRLASLPASTLIGEVDRHQGVWVDLSKQDKDGIPFDEISEKDFDILLKDSLKTWRGQGVTSAWLNLTLTQGKFLSVASKYGFTFHHAEGNQATLVLWMGGGQKSKIPMFATHQVGVSGIVIKEDTKEVLVVQDKNRAFQVWKFPGGLSDLGEDIAVTAEREVFEETGLKTEFQSVIAFRQHHNLPGAFGRSDLYILCRLKPLTFELHPCEEEIAACKWMSVEQLRTEKLAPPMTQKLADIVLLGLKNGFQHVDITSSEMKSLYKGMKYHLFHRPVK